MMKSRMLSLCLAVVLLGGCQMFSGTRMEQVSSEKARPATLQKVLLVGVTTTPAIQSDMERAFAREFAKHKREVLLASQQFPGDRQPVREEVVQRVRAEGVTGVLVVRLLNYEVGSDSVAESGFSLRAPARDPGTRVGWEQDPWLAAAQPVGSSMPTSRAIAETRIYDVATGAVVWQGRSRTLVRDNARQELEGFVFAVMRELHRSGWL